MDDDPRDPGWLKADLARLHRQRGEAQAKLVGLLNTLDAVDGKIAARLDELALALRPAPQTPSA